MGTKRVAQLLIFWVTKIDKEKSSDIDPTIPIIISKHTAALFPNFLTVFDELMFQKIT